MSGDLVVGSLNFGRGRRGVQGKGFLCYSSARSFMSEYTDDIPVNPCFQYQNIPSLNARSHVRATSLSRRRSILLLIRTTLLISLGGVSSCGREVQRCDSFPGGRTKLTDSDWERRDESMKWCPCRHLMSPKESQHCQRRPKSRDMVCATVWLFERPTPL